MSKWPKQKEIKEVLKELELNDIHPELGLVCNKSSCKFGAAFCELMCIIFFDK